jgi:hypothetical protein
MALGTTITWAEALVTDRSKTKRNLREAGESFYNVIETIETETREVRAIAYGTANTEVTNNVQPTFDPPLTPPAVATYSYTMSLANEIVGGYTVRRVYEFKNIAFEE